MKKWRKIGSFKWLILTNDMKHLCKIDVPSSLSIISSQFFLFLLLYNCSKKPCTSPYSTITHIFIKALCFCFGHQVISLRGSPGGATTATAGSRQGRGHATHRHSNRPHHAIWRIAHIRHAHACGHRWFARWCEGRSTPYIGDKLIPPLHRCMSNVSFWVDDHPLPTGNQWQETQHM